jgi:transposase
MSTREPKRKNKVYTQEFRNHAIDLAKNSSHPISFTARDLGIKAGTLYNWMNKESPDENSTMPKKPLPYTDKDLSTENTQLKKELAQAKVDLEILKKATAYFARDPK